MFSFLVLEDVEDEDVQGVEHGQEVEISEMDVVMSCEDFDDQHVVQYETDVQGRFEIEEVAETTSDDSAINWDCSYK